MFMRSTSFLVNVFVVNPLYHILKLLLFFFGSHHFNTYNLRENYYERSVGFASDEIKFIPSYAEHISYAKRISYCVAIFHSFRQERISLKEDFFKMRS